MGYIALILFLWWSGQNNDFWRTLHKVMCPTWTCLPNFNMRKNSTSTGFWFSLHWFYFFNDLARMTLFDGLCIKWFIQLQYVYQLQHEENFNWYWILMAFVVLIQILQLFQLDAAFWWTLHKVVYPTSTFYLRTLTWIHTSTWGKIQLGLDSDLFC